MIHFYSDGMGRSGVFICAMSEVERVKVEGQVDVFQTIKGMRIQRPHMVETAVSVLCTGVDMCICAYVHMCIICVYAYTCLCAHLYILDVCMGVYM